MNEHIISFVYRFFIYASSSCSSWLLVAVTCERIASTKWPHKVRLLCTQKSSTGVVLAIFLVIFGGTSHVLYGTTLSVTNEYILNHTTALQNNATNLSVHQEAVANTFDIGDVANFNRNVIKDVNDVNSTSVETLHEKTRVCNARKDGNYSYFFSFIYPWIDMCTYFFIPALFISIGEVIIIRAIFESRSLRRSMSRRAERTVSSNSVKVKDHTSSVTLMLLTVNAVFVACTTPISVYLIGMPYWGDTDVGFSRNSSIAWAVVNMLMYLNHTVNFILYFLSGARFRKKVAKLFRRDRIRLSAASQLDTESSSRNCGTSNNRTEQTDGSSPLSLDSDQEDTSNVRHFQKQLTSPDQIFRVLTVRKLNDDLKDDPVIAQGSFSDRSIEHIHGHCNGSFKAVEGEEIEIGIVCNNTSNDKYENRDARSQDLIDYI